MELLSLVVLLFCFPSEHALSLGGNSFRHRRSVQQRIGIFPFPSTLSHQLLGHWFAGTPSGRNSEKNFNVTADALAQAEEYRQRAQQLKAEAASLELSLKVAKTQTSSRKAADIASWMEMLFLNDRPMTASAVARLLEENRFSDKQVSTLLEALYKKGKISQPSTTPQAVNITVEPSILSYIQILLDAAKILDGKKGVTNRRWSGRVHSSLQSQLRQWNRQEEAEFKRSLAQLGFQNAKVSMNQTTVLTSSAPTAVGFNSNTSENVQGPLIPLWVPSGLVAEVNASRDVELSNSDILVIKDSVLSRSRFFCTSVESVQNAALFRGNLRGRTDPNTIDPQLSKTAFENMQREMKREPGLSDRVRLFFLNDPRWRPKDERSPQTIVLAIPKLPVLAKSRSRLVYAGAAAASLVATLFFAISCYALNPHFYKSVVLHHDLSVVKSCWPIVCGLLAIHAVHETAHHFVARTRGLQLGWPLCIPSLRFGSYGCITSLKSFPKNRDTMLDFSLSGPASSMALSLLFMTIGCLRTVRASEATLLAYPFVSVGSLRSSFLAGSMLTFLIPKFAVMPISQPVPVHPLVMVGWSGMVASALNLLPILRLDGGRACTAAMGSRFAAVLTAWTLLMMISFGPVAGLWALITVFLHRKPEVNALDEVTPVNKARVGAWAASIAFAVAALLPFPGSPSLF